jgi:response regulator of citrate/malate metabolism
MKKPSGSGRLTKSLDHKVARLIEQYQQEGNQNISTSNLYEYIQVSDVSLRRMKKLQLEKTIEKCELNWA